MVRTLSIWGGAVTLVLVSLSLSFLGVLFIFPSAAAAGTVSNDRPMLFDFAGGDSSIGPFTALLAVAGDESTGEIYAINAAGNGKGPGQFDDERVVCRFDANGNAVAFTAGESAGKSCLDGTETPGNAFGVDGFFSAGAFQSDVAIDNSGGLGGPGEGEQGRLYISEEGGPIDVFEPSGSYLRTLDLTLARPCGIAVDAKGNLLVGNGSGEDEARFKVLEFNSGGELIKEVPMTNSTKRACRLAINSTGKALYVGLAPEQPSGLDKYVDGAYDSSSTTGYRVDLAIDQSKADGHIFDIDSANFREQAPCNTPGCFSVEVPGSPFGGDLIGNAQGIAYNPTLDWVYVSDRASNTIKVFGPVTSGPVPDVSCQTAEPVGLHSLTANCTINALGLPNEYHFEWKQGSGSNWSAAESSSPQSIAPTDSSPHPVSMEVTEYAGKPLKSNASYQVRLVGTNTENGLNAYSNPDTPTTLTPPPPEVECLTASAVTTESAQVSCLVDPQEEETSWRILTGAFPDATQTTCRQLDDGKFQVAKEETIPSEELGAVEIHANLGGLLVAQSYCVRVIATDSGGSGVDDLSFKTLAIAPSEASAAFVAPRTDTTARINARLNPNGETDFKYRFEWSEDGSTWTELPLRESSLHSRQSVVIADELSGLQPATSYRYRLGLLENETGPASSLGEEGEFTTRTRAEVEEASPSSCPANEDARSAQHSAAYLGFCRGIELVNSPDKGNQNAFARGPGIHEYTSPISVTGNRVLWSVVGGAPGGYGGTESNFLAERTASGWASKAVAPAGQEQAGKGDFAYLLSAVSRDFDSLVFSTKLSTAIAPPRPPTFVRLRDGIQDILKRNTVQPPNATFESSVDLSEDGEHVIVINPDNEQLEDIGAARVAMPELGISAIPGEVLSLMPAGNPSECGLDVFDGKSFPGVLGSGIGRPGDHWISTIDASRVYFRAKPDGNCAGAYGLYVRNREAGQTTLIDSGASGVPPEFLRTTRDGSKAYFVTYSGLDSIDLDTDSPDIYEWNEDAGPAGESSCLTCLVKGADSSEGAAHLATVGGGLNGVLVSPDFSRIYFYSPRKIFPGEGQQGALNLYVLDGKEIHFVAVTQADVLSRDNSSVSANGERLLFETQANSSLTADRMASQCTQPSGVLGNCVQLYLYDEPTQSVECISCNQNGISVRSYGSIAEGPSREARLAGDGATAAFATPEALVPLDINGNIDIYEWRNGTVHLVTDGVRAAQKGFAAPRVWALDADGSDLIFGYMSPDRSLTGFERDGLLNVYDAKVNGGFVPPPPELHCVEDSCQGPLAPAQAVDQPASSGVGIGNPKTAPKRCHNGKVRRHGRCVMHRQRAKRHGAGHGRSAQPGHGRGK
jgi:hypothetical protein